MATPILEQVTTQYRKFVNDQVLTAGQLNTLIDYFEDQNRLTRVCLSGVGIVCGLNLKIEDTQISVSSGCGVTTDGDLVKYEGTTYTHVREFTDDNANYEPFSGIEEKWQLINSEDFEIEDGDTPIPQLAGIDTMVAVLYLENYGKEETPCASTVNCDSQGVEQVANVKILLLQKAAVEQMNEGDSVFSDHNFLTAYLELPHIKLKRVTVKPHDAKDYLTLVQQYRAAFFGAPAPFSKFGEAFNALTENFPAFINIEDYTNAIETFRVKIIEIFNFSSKEIPLDIQYRYGLMQDLLGTYNEIREALFNLKKYCCTSENSFPKHLLLGELFKTQDYFECRHAFYPAPIIPHNDERYKTLQLLFERMLLLCADYGVTQEDTVKITPSKKALNALGQRAIPYYYLTRPPLVRTWDALKTQTYSHLKNLGYQSGFLSTDDEIQNPLDYDISASDFYRIEGHLGLDYFDALQQVQDIKEDKGLPFDVKVLSINEDIANIDPEDYKCHFEDLNTILLAFLKEQECLYGDMAQFFSNFSTTNPGTHGRYGVKTLATAPPQEEVEEETGATTTTVPATTAVPTRRITPGDFTIASTRHIKARASTKLPEENLPLYFVPIKTKTPKKTIEEKIVSNEESLGYVVNSIMAKHADREPATLARKIRDEVNKIEAIAVLAPNVREVAVTFPYELIVYSREAAQHIPSTIADLSDAKLQRFNEASDRLCELVDNYQIALNNVLNNPQSNYQRRGFEPRMEMLLNQMASNCCAAEKIQVLMDDIERRKIEILTQKTLTAFAEKHPGMEHKAGVQPGGTFVMVYMGGRRRPNIPANSLISNTLAAARATNTREGAVLPKRALLNERAAVRIASHINLTEGSPTASRVPLAGPTELVALESDRIRPENNINILSAPNRRGPQQTPNITLNTIVADFSLPYMCCSDCAPINFIIPQAPVSLRLPQAQICYDKAEPPAPLLFEVIPADGIVKSTLSDGDNGGVIKNGDGNYVFDAGLIDPSHYGQTLEFTVNDQVTDATIVVNEIPKFTFEFTEPLYFKDGILAEVNFTVQGENFDAATTFIWEFGDGNESTEANPRHLYELTPNGGETIDFNVTLTVGKGACTHTETGTVTLDLQMPRIFIEESVCIPRQSTFETTVQFGTQPDGATVEITNDVPNVRIAENTLVFNRQFNAYGTPIEFAVNGHSVENTTTAIVRPEASIFVPNEQELFFNDNGECRIEFGINNQSVFDESLFNYHWDTGDGSNSTTVQPAHTHTFRVDPSTNRDVMRYTVTLVIEGEPSCEFRTSRPITIHVNHENL